MHDYDIIMLPLCQHDILDINKYITFSIDTPETVILFIRDFHNSFEPLLYTPHTNQLDGDKVLAKLGIYSRYYKNFKIFYYISKKEKIVYVLRILHRNMRMKSKYLSLN